MDNMQEYKTSYILPKRGRSDGSFKKLSATKFYTNFYDIQLASKQAMVYQYSFMLPQHIPQDSHLYEKAISNIKGELKDKIGYLAHSGQIIWGTIGLKTIWTPLCKITNQEKEPIQCSIKVTKQFNFNELNQESTRNIYIQLLNVSLKNRLRSMKLYQLGKNGQYFSQEIITPDKNKDDKKLQAIKLQFLKGFRFTLTPIKSKVYLRVDYCSRVLQQTDVCTKIFEMKRKKDSNEFINNSFVGKIVLSKYGNFKTYTIENIDFQKSPLDKFTCQKRGVLISYADYYKQAYGVTIKQLKQPLIRVLKKIGKELQKGQTKAQTIFKQLYLIPQLVVTTGLEDTQRKDQTAMKIMAPYTKLQPTQRMKKCSQIVKQLNGNKQGALISIKNSIKLQGYVLPKPQIFFNKKCIPQQDSGLIKEKFALKQAAQIKNWLIIYGGNNSDIAQDIYKQMKQAGQTYGIKFTQPQYLNIQKQKSSDWVAEIRNYLKNKQVKPMIVFVIVQSKQQTFYGELKKLFCTQLQVSSQFIRKSTYIRNKNFMSVASKVAIQMNVKVGSVPWSVSKRHQYFKNKKIIYGGFSISKGAKGYTLAFVGTSNDECTKVYSQAKYGLNSKENIPSIVLQDMIVEWIKTYYITYNRSRLPDVILIYRQGLSTPQIKQQLEQFQIKAIEGAIDRIITGSKNNNFKPQVSIVLANKKINSRFFNFQKQLNLNEIPNLSNVYSGSVIIDQLSTDGHYDFHLAAQKVTQGTCTPTLFRVAYNRRYPACQGSLMPQQALISFTFEQCFNYYNWQGAVRVPACLQSADKLSKLVSMHIKSDIGKVDKKENALLKMHFFL